MENVFLKLEHIKKSFGGVQALKDVSMEVKAGEIHCLAGENGCGKSTLIKVVSGAHEPTAGDVYIEGKKVEHLTPIDSIRMGIQVIYQDFAVFPNLTVAENIAMNHALQTGAKVMNWKRARELALKAMEMIGAQMEPDILVERLSVANKQMVAICRAIINDAKLLILDEPTTALTQKEVQKLNEIVRKLKAKGMAILIVNHKLDEIYEIADHLTILRNGENAGSGPIEEFDRKRFIYCMTGREVEEICYRPAEGKQEILRAERLSRRGCFEDVSFVLKTGDVLGITGLLGSGRGEIGDALFGLAPVTSGKLYLNGEEIAIRSVADAMKYKIAYVPEDRLTQGLFLDRSIQENTVAASIASYLDRGRLDYRRMYVETEQWIRKIGCNASSPSPKIKTLSGGNAQKMVIAKWLNTNPKLLVLNGPTVGVDVGSKADIHKILHELAGQGVGVIVISDDISELIQNCNKIMVMRNGKSSAFLSGNDLDEAKMLQALTGEGEIA